MAGLIARLTGVNIAVAALGLVSGPIQAHVLGPSGRGEVAAVVTTLAIATAVLDFGLTTFVARARARGTEARLVYGTVVPMSCAFSLIGVVAAYPVAHLLGQGRDTVVLFLQIGLILSPVSVALLTLSGVLWGEERWRLVGVMRAGGALLAVAALATLAIADRLTVAGAIVSTVGSGLLGSMAIVFALRGSGRWRYHHPLAREALAFGAHNWLASIVFLANFRLDQLLMAGLSSSRQLGLYAVATTVATFSSVFVGALTLALFPRVARGDPQLAQQACRVALILVALTSVVVAAIVPLALPLLFGDAFDDAVPMALILLIAGVSSACTTVLGVSLAAAGHPRATVRPQLVGLALSIPALLIALPVAGGIGASVIAVVTGAVTAGLMLAGALRGLGGTPREYLLPTSADLRAVRKALRSRASR